MKHQYKLKGCGNVSLGLRNHLSKTHKNRSRPSTSKATKQLSRWEVKMSIAISGQYIFRGKAGGGSAPVGIIYPDTTRGKVFAPAPGESFTETELFEIAEIAKNAAFSVGRKRRTLKREAESEGVQ